MTTENFWSLIHQSKLGMSDCEEQARNLTALLENLEPEEIISFAHRLQDRLNEAYRWDLWGVAYIIKAGCSDDAFEYFRGWQIAQGKDLFEQMLANPEDAALNLSDEDLECERILYADLQAYENRTGHEMPQQTFTRPPEPQGEPWKEEDLDRLYPKLTEKFG